MWGKLEALMIGRHLAVEWELLGAALYDVWWWDPAEGSGNPLQVS